MTTRTGEPIGGEIDIPVDFQYMIGVAIGEPDEVPEQKPRDPSRYKIIR